ncbi:MAG: GNAT family N-acetyltransferase [Rhodocyclaceae bacterium]|nr:GNAT family N-acetyltransferase [Rhodocyclaceae bacterium]
MNQEHPAENNTDPHITPVWFKLIESTAIPPGSDVNYISIGLDSYLPTLRLPSRKNELLGLSTFYSPLFGAINQSNASRDELEKIFKEIRNDSLSTTTINFSPLDPEDKFFSTLKSALKSSGWITDSYFCFGNWYEILDNSEYKDYFSNRPSRLRNTITRGKKKLAKDPSFSISLHTEQNDELDGAISDFIAVYNLSWKKPEPFPAFIPELCRLAAKRGWLRLGILRLDSIPVAAQIWLISNQTAYIVKLAYRQDYSKRSVGSVLTAYLMEHAIDIDKVKCIDYLIGDDTYKREWTPLRRERHGIVAFNLRTTKGFIAALRHFTGKSLKKLIK